jgi:hypothetical protein
MAPQGIHLTSVFVAFNARGYRILLLAFPVYLSTYSQVEHTDYSSLMSGGAKNVLIQFIGKINPIFYGQYIFFLSYCSMLNVSDVTTAWRVLRLRMEETASRYGE